MSSTAISKASAPLPRSYEHAQEALAKCESIDECKDWKDKAAALASYAKQADDESLFKTAMRIKGRAVRRMGELLREIEPRKGAGGGRPRSDGKPTAGSDRKFSAPTRTDAARAAGLSERQQAEAIRIASIPHRQFEKAIEAQEPPTLTALAKQGTTPRTSHLKGRDPKEFNEAIHVRGAMRRFAEKCDDASPAAVVRGSDDADFVEMKKWAKTILRWVEGLQAQLEKRS